LKVESLETAGICSSSCKGQAAGPVTKMYGGRIWKCTFPVFCGPLALASVWIRVKESAIGAAPKTVWGPTFRNTFLSDCLWWSRESEDGSSVWYYSTTHQLDELVHVLDADRYERDLVQVIGEMREEIDRQMLLTEQLTKAVQAGRKSVIDVLNGTFDLVSVSAFPELALYSRLALEWPQIFNCLESP